jgi:hypothetical protein
MSGVECEQARMYSAPLIERKWFHGNVRIVEVTVDGRD